MCIVVQFIQESDVILGRHDAEADVFAFELFEGGTVAYHEALADEVFFMAIKDAVGGELNATTMSELNSDQITLWAYRILRDEVMDGGFVQLIQDDGT